MNRLPVFFCTFKFHNSFFNMRKIILNVAVTLDGLIEGPNGEYDWCFTDQDYGMTPFIDRIDTIFFGRKSFEILESAGENPFSDFKMYVFSTTLKSLENVTIISSDVEETVRQMKNEEGKDIWLFGGASLTTLFINAGLVDELMLSIHPLLLGEGKLLFQSILGRIPLELTDTRSYSSGLVQLLYTIPK